MIFNQFFSPFSDGASAHFKNNASIYNLVNHKADFGLDACWTFTATGHGKGAGDGIGAVLKSTARRITLSKNILLSSPKDFYEFLRQHQLETADTSNKANPGVHTFFLEAGEVEKAKDSVLKTRAQQIPASGRKNESFFLHLFISIQVRSKVFEQCTNSNQSMPTQYDVAQHLDPNE